MYFEIVGMGVVELVNRLVNYEMSGVVKAKLENEKDFSNLSRVSGTRHNYTFVTGNGDILKYYTNLSPLEVFLAILNFLSLEFLVQTAETRLKSEIKFRNSFDGIKTPEVLDSEDRYMLEEKVEGVNLETKLLEKNIDPYRVGLKIGRIVRLVREEECSIWDIKPEDFIESGGELYLTDAEWFLDEKIIFHDALIKANFISSSRKFPDGISEELKKGFREELGDFTLIEFILSKIIYRMN